MDRWERLAKVETEVDTIKEHLREIKAEQVRLREHMDRGFAEIRAEQAKTTRWLVSLTITYGTAIVGMMAKLAGLF